MTSNTLLGQENALRSRKPLSVESISPSVSFQQRCHFHTAARIILCLELSYDVRKTESSSILFVDGTSILITSPNSNQLQSDLSIVFAQLNKWFKSNLLFLNFDKTHFIQFNNASKCKSVTEI